MTTILNYSPGQTVTIIQQVVGLDGYREDGYMGAPVVARVVLPGFTLAVGYPISMTQLDTGLYSYSFILPTGAISVGTYIVDIYWYHPDTLALQQTFVQVQVSAPFGLYNISTSAG